MLKYATFFMTLLPLQFVSMNLSAMTLTDALAKAYESNFGIKSAAESAKATDEGQAQALSSAMPKAQLSGSRGKSMTKGQQTAPVFANPNTGQFTYITAPTKSDGIMQNHQWSVTQPLFAGGAIFNTIRQSHAAAEGGVAAYYAAEQQILLSAVQTYLNVLLQRESKKINTSQVESLAVLLKGAEERFAVGELTVTDVSQAKSQLASAQAVLAQSVASLESEEANFTNIVGTMPPAELATPAPYLSTLPDSPEAALERALARNPALEQSELQAKAAHYATNSKKGALLPSANFTGSANRADAGYPRLTSQKTSQQLMFNLNVPIFQGGAEYANIRQAQHQERQALMDRDNTRSTLRYQTYQSWQNMLASKQALESNRVAVAAAKVALDGITEEYKQGARTLLDVLTTETQYFQAQLGEANAHYSYILTTYAVHYYMGEMRAADLHLPVSLYDPHVHRKNTRFKLIGFAS